MKKRISVKLAVLLVSAVLLLGAAVGTTAAFLVDRTPSLNNTFVPVSVSCKVQESFDEATNTKTNVSVKNTGDIKAYIRAAIVVNWAFENGDSVYGGAPVSGIDYIAVFSENGWVKGSDGFYYCASPISSGGETPILIESVTPIAGKAPEGYVLSVNIIASAIQAEPADAVISAWRGITVNSDGTIAPELGSER